MRLAAPGFMRLAAPGFTRRTLPWSAALALGLALVVVSPAVAPASERAAHVAGVTVSFGPGNVVHRTVTFTGASITGVEALQGAGFSVEVYGYGGIGAAVCRIDGVGRPADSSCLNGGTDYWAYFRNGRYSSVGAGATQVHDRDQEQWAWGSGDHAPPTTAFEGPTTTRPAVTTTTAPPPPPAGGGVTSPTHGADPVPGSSTTAPGSTTTVASRSTAAPTPSAGAGDTSEPRGSAGGEAIASEPVARTASPDEGGGGGGGPLALAGFAVVLAAVVGLTLRARSARGNGASRN